MIEFAYCPRPYMKESYLLEHYHNYLQYFAKKRDLVPIFLLFPPNIKVLVGESANLLGVFLLHSAFF